MATREKNMKKNLEMQEVVEEIKDILKNIVDPITEVIEIEDDIEKKYEDCGCETCKKLDVSCDKCPVCSKGDMDKAEELSDEDISKTYDSDNEDEDKWDNVQKACWSGYKQVGMKDKGGRQVPNCVPIKKSLFGTEGPSEMVPKNSK